MIDVSVAAVERLVTRHAGAFSYIGYLADFAALSDLPRSVPAAYIIPVNEQAGADGALDQSVQTHRATFSVVIIVRHAGDATGAKATLALAALRETVHAALVGWLAPDCAEYTGFVGGELAEMMDGGFVSWRDDFTTSRVVQRAAA